MEETPYPFVRYPIPASVDAQQLVMAAPEGITLNAAGTLTYITNDTNNSVMLYSINSNTGALSGYDTVPGAFLWFWQSCF